MTATATKQTNELMLLYQYQGNDPDVPTLISPGDGTTYEVVDGQCTAPARNEAGFRLAGFVPVKTVRVKRKANGEGERK